jgi:hypothetical protein
VSVTDAQLKAYLDLVAIVHEIVTAGGSLGKPSGEVYALTMNVFPDVARYEQFIDVLVGANILQRSKANRHLLIANPIGAKLEQLNAAKPLPAGES